MGHYECNHCGQEMSHCVCGKESPAKSPDKHFDPYTGNGNVLVRAWGADPAQDKVFDFESFRLTKIDMARPEYMNGHDMLANLKLVSSYMAVLISDGCRANYAWQPTPGTLKRLTEEALNRNISVSKLIRDFVEAGLGHEGPG